MMSVTTQKLLEKHAPVWQEAIAHPFLDQCQTGEILASQFNTWLVQDYLFVLDFTRMAARLLAAAPIHHFDLLLGGLSAIRSELVWFVDKATERQLTLAVARQPTCDRYCQLMTQLADSPYAVQAIAFWAIELAYNQAWQRLGPLPAPYTEFGDRWGNPAFTHYVQLLEQQANQVLQDSVEATQQQAEAIFLEVAKLEKEFWQMAFNANL